MSAKKPVKRRWQTAAQISAAIDALERKRNDCLRTAENLELLGQSYIRLAQRIDDKQLPIPQTPEQVMASLPELYLTEQKLKNLMRGMGMGRFKQRDWLVREGHYMTARWPRILEQHKFKLRVDARMFLDKAKRLRVRAVSIIPRETKKLGQDLAVMRTEAMPFLPLTNAAGDVSIPAA